jgi:8-oxo-dGTP diphosphatase
LTVYIVRHARAGRRSAWKGPDDLRPLTKPGRRQAEALVELLAREDITRIVASPYVRCRQTVEPLAQRCRVPVELSDSLAEGSPLREVLRLVEKVSDEQAVLCAHGDEIGALLDHLREHRVPVDGDKYEKGSTWALDVRAGTIVAARYFAPPT